MNNDYKRQALVMAGFEKLPEKSTRNFEGLAIAKVKKLQGGTVYVMVKFDDKLKKVLVVHDFCRGRIDGNVEMEIYPDPKSLALTPKEVLANMKAKLVELDYKEDTVKSWTKDKCLKEIEGVFAIKQELAKLGLSDAEGTLEDLQKIKDEADK